MQRERKPKNFLPKPNYRGGPKAMSKFIKENLRYPPEAKENNISGTVVLRIAIDYKGKVTGAKVKSGIGYGCDEEAIRVVRLLEFDIDNKVRRGKILFHKNVNINFRITKVQSPKESKKAEPSQTTQLSYFITKKKQKDASKSFSYTIKIDRD